MEGDTEEVAQEIESLRAIYGEDLVVHEAERVVEVRPTDLRGCTGLGLCRHSTPTRERVVSSPPPPPTFLRNVDFRVLLPRPLSSSSFHHHHRHHHSCTSREGEEGTLVPR